ncbi:phosphotransferase family protein [Paracoccus pantotrophus]|uniref:phosphotransferase family protein n=1 Tax=Paracoccus pantotrophus TaxID=82367 RepID=UPI00048C2398|nr:phosphotransferase family protein [Paracoccus pantotrophus]
MTFTEDMDKTQALADWLDRNCANPGAGALTLSPLSGGSSGTVLRLRRGALRAVLRTVGTPPRADSLKALTREAQVLRALAPTPVPHPRFIAFCEDPAVLGSPFLLMAEVQGWTGSENPPDTLGDPEGLKRETTFALIDGLAALAQQDPQALGLGGFGHPEGFLERQADRWKTLMDRHRAHPDYGDRALPGFDRIGAWLKRKRPEMQRVSLIHGDMSFSNVMFSKTARPVRLAAIIDWEISTLGDPLLDLGRALYPFPSQDGTPGVSLQIDHSGYPPREELAARYAEKVGLGVASLDYYMVLSMYKLAALIEFNHVKSMNEPEGSMAHRIAGFVPQLIDGAEQIIRRSAL